MRYGAGTIKWNKEELQEIDRKSKKIMTMNDWSYTLEVMLPEYTYQKKGRKRPDHMYSVSYTHLTLPTKRIV